MIMVTCCLLTSESNARDVGETVADAEESMGGNISGSERLVVVMVGANVSNAEIVVVGTMADSNTAFALGADRVVIVMVGEVERVVGEVGESMSVVVVLMVSQRRQQKLCI